MKKTLNRSLSLLLALVLAVSLAVPALAADEPVTLDQTKLSLSPKQSVVLHATRSSEYQDQRITWKSSDTSGGQYVDTVLKAPVVTIRSGATDVTDAYTLSYRWTDSAQKELGTQDTQLIQPVTLSDLTVTCTVTATSKTDSTQVLTGSCRYGVKVYPGTTVGAAHALTKGSVTLDKLMDLEGKQSILDQLLQGDGDSLLTPAIPGLTHVVFDMNSVTGAAVGTLSARGEVEYYLSREADGNHLADVSFTPLQAGTYGINFLAYGDQVYYGRLEVVVSGQAVEPPDGEDIPCDCTGYTFTGSDFFHSGDADPVAAVLFGKPSAGQLLRDLAHGSGVAEEGARYYTNAASNGEYHVSTLSYLPNAGFSGRVTLPVTLITQSGKQVEDTLSFYVTSKTHSEQFTDVTETTVGLWAADAVDFAYHFGLVSGVEETKFAPNSPMTRAQLVTVLYRAAGSPEVTVTTNFEDLDVGAYYYNAVVWGNVMGVVNGTSDTTFSPNAYVTREQLATILYRYADTMGDNVAVSGNLNAYTDKDKVGSYAVTPMTWAVEHGIITGTTGTTLSPKSTTTRAQVAVMLHRYLTD